MSFYVYETKVEHARICDECGEGMNEGYLRELENDTYCSIACLDNAFDLASRDELLTEGTLFWTDWHDESRCAE